MLESLEPPKTLRITVFVVGVLAPQRSLSKTLGVVSAVVLTVSVKVSSLAMRVFVVGVVVVGVVVVVVVGVVVVGVVVVGEVVVGVLVVGVLVVGVVVFVKRTTVAVAVAQGAFPLSGQSW